MSDRYSWSAADVEVLDPVEKFDDDQPRDEAGRWTYAGGPSSASKDAPAGRAASAFIAGRDRVPVGSGLSHSDLAFTKLRGEVKHDIATKVAARLKDDPRFSGDAYETVNQMNRAWAQMDTADIQHAAAREFGIAEHAEVRPGASDRPGYGPALRAMYQHTQDALAGAGIERVTLYRGVFGDANARPAPVTSWTSERRIAESGAWMGGGGVTHVLAATFPRDRILSTARTGFGSLPEYEFTVLAGPGDIGVEKYDDSQPRDESGKWTDGGGGAAGGGASLGASRATAPSDAPDERGFSHLHGGLGEDPDGPDPDGIEMELKEEVVTAVEDRLLADPRWDATRDAMADPPSTRDAVRATVNQWAATSGDHDPTSLSLQIAAAREFGLDQRSEAEMLDRTDGDTAKQAIGMYGGHGSTAGGAVDRAVLRSIYEGTQERLAADGVKEVTLYRGLHQPERSFDSAGYATGWRDQAQGDAWEALNRRAGQAVAIRSNPLSSWSLDRDTAGNFAVGGSSEGLVLSATFPASRILSTPRTGLGCYGESEWVVLDGPGEAMVVGAPDGVGE